MSRKTPIGTIKADDNGEGFLDLNLDFLRLPPITRADILKDILWDVRFEYKAALRELKSANRKVGGT